MGTFSLSLDATDVAAPLGFLAAGLPLPLSVIDVKGPGMSSLPSLLLVDLDIPRGTGMCVASIGDWVLGGFGNLFGCISGVGWVGSPRADLDLGALFGGRWGCRYGVSGATIIGVSRIGVAICGVGDGDTLMGAGAIACATTDCGLLNAAEDACWAAAIRLAVSCRIIFISATLSCSCFSSSSLIIC